MEVKAGRWQHPEIAPLKQKFLCSYCSRALVRTGGGHLRDNLQGEKEKNKIKAVLGGKKTTEGMGRKGENYLYASLGRFYLAK